MADEKAVGGIESPTTDPISPSDLRSAESPSGLNAGASTTLLAGLSTRSVVLYYLWKRELESIQRGEQWVPLQSRLEKCTKY